MVLENVVGILLDDLKRRIEYQKRFKKTKPTLEGHNLLKKTEFFSDRRDFRRPLGLEKTRETLKDTRRYVQETESILRKIMSSE